MKKIRHRILIDQRIIQYVKWCKVAGLRNKGPTDVIYTRKKKKGVFLYGTITEYNRLYGFEIPFFFFFFY